MKPSSFGYDRPNTNAGFQSIEKQGIQIQNDIDLPSQIMQGISTNVQYPLEAARNFQKVPYTKATPYIPTTINTPYQIGGLSTWKLSPTANALKFSAPAFTSATTPLGTLGSGGVGSLSAKSASEFFGTKGLQMPSATSTGTKFLPTVASKIASVAGIATSGVGLANDFINQDKTVTQADIANSAPVISNTTAEGNTYTSHGGVDAQGALARERTMAAAKKANLILNSMGMGASIGSLFPGLGTVIGGIAGTVLGAAGSLLGFGENEDIVNQRIKNQQDLFAMQDRQSESDARDKDAKQSYYGAACGKLPGYSIGKGVAKLSGGEVVQLGPLKVEVPGRKNNKDEYTAREGTLLGEMLKNKQSIVYTNKGGVSDYIKNGGDENIALAAMRNIQKNYKNGKLPKYALGWDGILATLPHLGSLATNLAQYNRVIDANTYAPDTYVDNAEGAKALDILASQRFKERPYLTGAERAYRQANWNTNRNVGLGLGGRAIAMNANYRNYLDALAGINVQKNDADAKYSQVYAQALQQLGAANQQARINSAVNKHQWMQMANAAKENSIAQYLKNINQAGINGVAEYFKWKQYQDALSTQNKMLRLYENESANDTLKTQAAINNLTANNNASVSTWTPPAWMQRRNYIPNTLLRPDWDNWRIGHDVSWI